SAELHRLERNIHLLLHPVVRVLRDASGRRTQISSTSPGLAGVITESTMHVEIDQETEQAELDRICAAIESVLADVRLSVADFRAMRAQLAKEVEDLDAKGSTLPMPQEEVAEAREFLRWLDDGNFSFLGYR